MEGEAQILKEEVVHINGISSDLDREMVNHPDIEMFNRKVIVEIFANVNSNTILIN